MERGYRCAIKPDADDAVTSGLHVALGLEIALAAYRDGLGPVWAVASPDAIANFPPLNGIEAISFLVGEADVEAAEMAASRWRRDGREASVTRLTSGTKTPLDSPRYLY